MLASTFCHAFQLPELFANTIKSDPATFTTEWLQEAIDTYRIYNRAYIAKPEKRAKLGQYLAKLIQQWNELVDPFPYRLRSRYKPRSIVLVFVCLLRFFDTYSGSVVLRIRSTGQVWKSIDIMKEKFTSSAVAKLEMQFLCNTFESGKTWLAKEHNLV